ncbi:hypothetical protein P7K49_018937 [Saguinus oedipus]|uniref:Uncharacterized protein n=1 Tax=Saguinus oedipus TaxID=9490 RepID=A0ABQ9UWP9_SAGOE|nr:hypothetical protein P7K49_018937 [Saguinus oedipus]
MMGTKAFGPSKKEEVKSVRVVLAIGGGSGVLELATTTPGACEPVGQKPYVQENVREGSPAEEAVVGKACFAELAIGTSMGVFRLMALEVPVVEE